MIDSPESAPVAANKDESPAKSAGQVLEIARPRSGELRVVDVERASEVEFAFDLEQARVIALDVDLIIAFTDGGKLLLPNLGLLAASPNPPSVRSSGHAVTWEQVFSRVTDVTLGEPTAQLASVGNVAQAGKPPQDETESKKPTNTEGEPPQPPVEPAPLTRAKPTPPKDDVQAGEPPIIKSHPLELPKPIVVTSSGSVTRNDPPVEMMPVVTPGVKPLKISVTFDLFNSPVATPATTNSDGSRNIYYAPGGPGSDTDPSYVTQAGIRPAPAAGTAQADRIYLDDPNVVPAGYAYRKFFIAVDSLTAGLEISKVTISGFPPGVSLVGYQLAQGVAVIPADAAAGGQAEVGLLYKLPVEGAAKDALGFFDRFELSVTASAVNAKGVNLQAIEKLQFGVRDVASAADAAYEDETGLVNVLWTNPPGAVVDGAGGDDTIFSSAGADVITGGAGADLVSYASSSRAVTVDLGKRIGAGGYAQGDIFLDEIERLDGSVYADSLVGSSGANTFRTGGGADTIDGAGGSDTVDFSASKAGVTVNLSSKAAQSGGDAESVVLFNIGNVIGSEVGANSLVGDSGDNYFKGGAQNDTFVGGGGRDTFIGGAGYNLVDVSGATTSLFIDLQGGDGAFSNISKVIGANFGDTFAGDVGNEELIGGAGADSFAGGAGADTGMGGAGADTFREDAGQDSWAGGAGDDLLIVNANFLGVQFDGGAGSNTIDLSSYTTSSSQALAVGLFEDRSGRIDWPGSGLTGNFLNAENIIGAASVANRLTGDELGNLLVGGSRADTISAGDGADTVIGGAGNDILDGGGNAGDTIDYSGATAALAVTVSGSGYTALIGAGEADTLSGFVNFIGTAYDDRIFADAQSNVLSSGAGNDTLSPGLGADTLDGGVGNDVVDLSYMGSQAISFSVAASTVLSMVNGQSLHLSNIEGVIGASGNDTLQADANHAGFIGGGAGDDRLVASSIAGGATFDGGAGVDTLDYSIANKNVSIDLSASSNGALLVDRHTDIVRNVENFIAGSGSDTVTALNDSLAHNIAGGAGDDSLAGGSGDDVLSGSTGADTLFGSAGADSLSGGADSDSLSGGAGADTILGDAGADTIAGGVGADSLVGDAQDVLDYRNSDGVSIDLASGRANADGAADTLSGFEQVFGSTSSANTLVGDDNANTLVGGAGDDYFLGRLGADSFVGVGGVDTLDYSARTLGISGTLDASGSVVLGAGEIDRYSGVTRFLLTSGGDTITSGSASQYFAGGAGEDSFVATSGGADTIDAGSDRDSISFANAAISSVTADLSGTVLTAATVTAGGVSRVDYLANFEVIAGSGGSDSFIGGGNVAHTFVASTGNDTYSSAQGGSDLIDYSAYTGATAILVDLAAAQQSAVLSGPGGVKTDRFVNIHNIAGPLSAASGVYIGDQYDDRITGGSGADSIIGGAGNDTLAGGLGADTIFGIGRGLADAGDLLDYSYTNGVTTSVFGLTYDMISTSATVTIGAGDIDVIGRFMHVIGTRGSDSIVTDANQNFVNLGLGDDTVVGGSASDSFIGGAGNDVLDFSGQASNISVMLGGETAATVFVNGAENAVFREFEGFVAGSGDDAIEGDVGANMIIGNGGADTLSLNGGDDSASGGLGADSLFGGDGADNLTGGPGNDTIDGGDGADAVLFTDATSGVTLVFNGDAQVTAAIGAERETLRNIEIVVGSDYADSLASLVGFDSFASGAGNDTLVAAGGANSMAGGAGDDLFIIDPTAGGDTLDGGDGVDTLDFSRFGANVWASLGDGYAVVNNRTITLVNFENIIGGDGNDTLAGDAQANILDGGKGDDSLFGGAGNDTLYGREGADTLRGGSGVNLLKAGGDTGNAIANDDLTEGLGLTVDWETPIIEATRYNDTITGLPDAAYTFSGLAGDDILIGNNFDDSLLGGDGADTLLGLAGNDTIDGGAGNDSLDGGDGSADLLNYSSSTLGISIVVPGGNTLATVRVGSTEADKVINFEYVLGGAGADTISFMGNEAHWLGGGAGDDSLLGGIGNDTILAGSGADTIVAGGGDDYLVVGDGNQQIDGGAGNDVADLSGVGPVSMALGANRSDLTVVLSSGASIRLVGVENLIASSFDDTLTGNDANNRIIAGAGNDSIAGEAGADTILGGLGNDSVNAGLGSDSVDGGDGLGDAIIHTGRGAALSIALQAGVVSSVSIGAGEIDSIVNIENVFGGSGADTLSANDSIAHMFFGDAGADSLIGGSGADTLLGGVAADTLIGGAGSDSLDGGVGVDVLSYAANSVGVSVSFASGSVANVSVAPGETDSIVNIENILGGSGADTISAAGDTVAHLFAGGAGDDYLMGGSGADTLQGGAGADKILASSGADVLDGGDGNDMIDYAGLSANQSVALSIGSDSTVTVAVLQGGATVSLQKLVNFENFVGTAQSDTLAGGATNDTLMGGDGDDSIAGLDGADSLVGGGGRDTLDGGLGNDTLDGGDGGVEASYVRRTVGVSVELAFGSGHASLAGGEVDTLINIQYVAGTSYADTISAAANDTVGYHFEAALGNDCVVGGAGDDSFVGGEGDDTIVGGGGANRLLGATGSDSIVSGFGNDTIDGGADLDTLSYADRTDGFSIAFQTGTASTVSLGAGEFDSIVNIENLIGGAGKDTISAADDSVAHLLAGGGGDDSLVGGSGHDTLLGGSGDDTLDGGLGNDSIDGGSGVNMLSYAARTIGLSVVFDASNAGTITLASGEKDVITNIENLVGGSGGDTLVAVGQSAHVFDGGLGDDSLIGGAGDDTLLGGDGEDKLVGAVGGDSLDGGAGNDTLIGGLGDDTLDGGDGSGDVVSYADDSRSFDLVFLNGSLSVALPPDEKDIIVNVENIIAGSGADTISAAGDSLSHFIDGGAGADCLMGGYGADTLIGGAGNDTILSSAGADVLDGGDGFDILSFSDMSGGQSVSITGSGATLTAYVLQNGVTIGVQTLVNFEGLLGSGNADTLTGGNVAEILNGGAGDDSFAGLLASDTIDGGDGADVISFESSSTPVSLALGAGANAGAIYVGGVATGVIANIEDIVGSAGADTIAAASGDTVARIISGGAGNDLLVAAGFNETIDGGADNDILVGGAGANHLFGGDGHDSITGGSGAESLLGGAGNDTIVGGGLDLLAGGAGNDSLVGGASDETFYGENGADTITGGGGLDLIYGGAGADSLTAGASNDTLYGDDGADILVGGNGENMLSGGLGNDSIVGGAGTETLVGDEGDDTLLGNDGSDSLVGGDGNDLLIGTASAAKVFGGAGNDTVLGSIGADVLDGGDGTDVLDYSSLTVAISAAMTGSSITVSIAGATQTLMNFEELIGSSVSDDLQGSSVNETIDGYTGADTISADGGQDSVLGGAGADSIMGAAGNDTIDGGVDADVLDYSALGGPVSVSVGPSGWITILKPNGESDLVRNIELVRGTSGADTLIASSSLSVNGGGGDDSIWSTGAASIAGGAGNDTIYSGPGADTIDGGDGFDAVSYADRTTAISVSMSGASILLSTGSETDTLLNIEALVLGSGSDNVRGLDNTNYAFYANAGADTVSTQGGNDTLDGGAGADSLSGGAGNDLYIIDDAGDSISDTSGVDTIQTSNLLNVNLNAYTSASVPMVENLSYVGSGDFSGTGNWLDNMLTGSTGADSFFGAYGDDTLDGGAGGDTLNGGRGNDSVLGGLGDDSLHGGGGADTISGGAGADTLVAYNDNYYFVTNGANNAVTGTFATPLDIKNSTTGKNELSFAFSMRDSLTPEGFKFAGVLASDGTNTTQLMFGLNPGTPAPVVAAYVYVNGAAQLIGTFASSGIAFDGEFHSYAVSLSSYSVNGTPQTDIVLYRDGVQLPLTGAYGGANISFGNMVTQLQLSTRSAAYSSYEDVSFWSGKLSNAELAMVTSGYALASPSAPLVANYDGTGTNTVTTGPGAGVNLVTSAAISVSTGGSSLSGGDGADSLLGGAAADTLSGGDGADTIDGGSGADVVDYSYLARQSAFPVPNLSISIGTAPITLTLGAGDTDVLKDIMGVIGSTGDDTLLGDATDNFFSGGLGNDSLDGGAGNDTIDYSYITDPSQSLSISLAVTVPVTVSLAPGDVDTIVGFENVFGGAGNDTLVGAGGPNILMGGGGDDSLSGAAGFDTFVGGLGNDTIDGGVGTDLVDYSAKSLGIRAQLNGANYVTVSVGAGEIDLLKNVEQLIGGSGDDCLVGDASNNWLFGGLGNDTIAGGAGNDSLVGGGQAGDLLDYSNSVGGLSIAFNQGGISTVSITNQTGGANEVDYVFGFRNLMGSSYADTVIGDGTANFLSLGAGNDSFLATAGADTIDGGDGVDTLTYDTGFASSVTPMTMTLGGDVWIGGVYGGIVRNIENIVGLLNSTDSIVGDSRDNLVDGRGGNDILSGNAGADTLLGGAGNDVVSGGVGNDSLDGGAGFDSVDYSYLATGLSVSLAAGAFTVTADSEVDVLINFENVTGGSGNDTILGDGAANVLSGGNGNDALRGAAGADIISGGLGNDALDGGDGADLADYSYVSAGVLLDLAAGTATGGSGDVDTLVNIENVLGGTGNDTLAGDAGANSLSGQAGSDLLRGNDGADTLTGGVGGDTLSGGAGNDSLDGGADLDAIDVSYLTTGVSVSVTTGLFTLTLGSGDVDTLVNFDGVIGGSGADTLLGDFNANILSGGAGNDCLAGYGNNDTISGGLGNDRLDGGNSLDIVDYSYVTGGISFSTWSGTYYNFTLGVGDVDSIVNFEGVIGGSGADTLTGDANANYLGGGLGVDTLQGNDGLDTLSGGAGNDTLDGGAGIDVVDYSYVGAALSVDLSAGATFTLTVGAGDVDTLVNLEGVIGSFGADTLIGDANANIFAGGLGNDIQQGKEGADTLSGGLGNDTLDGGAGVDVVDYIYVTTALSIDLSRGPTFTLSAGAGDVDMLINMEGVLGGSGIDTLIGDANANYLSGGLGADLVQGGDGADTLSGGPGLDTLDGGAGADIIDYTYWNASLSIDLSRGPTFNVTVSGGDVDTLTNFEGVMGGYGADTLTGDANANVLSGGYGNDVLDGGSGFDIADYGYSTRAISIDLSTGSTITLTVNVGDVDTLTNFEGVTGGSGADSLAGDANANVLSGGLGNDTLSGGSGGADSLFGGGGDDLINFNRASFAGLSIDGGAGADTIRFQSGGTYSGADLAAAITNVEVLDFRNAGVSVNLSLGSADLAKVAGLNASSQRELSILTDAGDTISVTDQMANVESTVNGRTTDYMIYDAAVNDPSKHLVALLHVTST